MQVELGLDVLNQPLAATRQWSPAQQRITVGSGFHPVQHRVELKYDYVLDLQVLAS